MLKSQNLFYEMGHLVILKTNDFQLLQNLYSNLLKMIKTESMFWVVVKPWIQLPKWHRQFLNKKMFLYQLVVGLCFGI